jgi:hypothetical protein
VLQGAKRKKVTWVGYRLRLVLHEGNTGEWQRRGLGQSGSGPIRRVDEYLTLR